MKTLATALCLLIAGCGSSVKDMPGPNPSPNESRATTVQPETNSVAQPEEPPAPRSKDAPEISRGVGKPGEAVVLWPRIVVPRDAPPPDDALRQLARAAQSQLAAAARDAQYSDVDVRPEPERVCPRGGCKAVTIGALVTRAGKGCAVMVLVGGAGESPSTIHPWIGRVHLDRDQVEFREPPEKYVHVDDYVPCEKVAAMMQSDRARIEAAVRGAR